MNLKLLFTLIGFSFFQCFAQVSKYDSIYSKVSTELLNADPKKSLINIDYLYNLSENNTERIKACMLNAKLLRQYGFQKVAILSLNKADSLATIEKNHFYLARINGFLSTLYRESKIVTLGKNHLNKAMLFSNEIDDKNEMYKFKGNLFQELAYYEMEVSNYSKAIEHLKKGEQFLNKITSSESIDKSFLIAINSEMLAKNYLSLQKADSAVAFYNKAKLSLNHSQSANSPLKGFIYNGLGDVYMTKKEYKNALLNYKEAEKIAEESNFHILKQEIYESLLSYFKTTNDNKNYIIYSELQKKLYKQTEKEQSKITNSLVEFFHKKENDNHSTYNRNVFGIVGVSAFLISGTLLFASYKRRKEHKKFQKYIAQKDNIKNEINAITSETEKDKNKEYMPLETEQRILEGLNEFEKSKHFLNNEISLNVVAVSFGINHRYLSYVINKHKMKDFASYINELRINYITDKLKENPDYLKYKISYLADECGFSSHSRFTVTFKQVKGVSPLTFINYVKKNNQNSKSA